MRASTARLLASAAKHTASVAVAAVATEGAGAGACRSQQHARCVASAASAALAATKRDAVPVEPWARASKGKHDAAPVEPWARASATAVPAALAAVPPSGRSHCAPFAPSGAAADLRIVRSEGVSVFDESGRRYLDGLAGLWSTLLGGSEPRLVEAATKQLSTLPYFHSFWGTATPPAEMLADELCARFAAAPMARVSFTCSGSEANDTLLKLVRYYNNALGRPHKKKVLARDRGYHGSTLAAASLTGLSHLHTSFDLPMPGVVRVGCPDYYRHGRPGESERDFGLRMAAELRQQILDEDPNTVAALFAEPVQGAGGVIIPPDGYWEEVQKTLKEFDILLVADEVVSGFGRTGAWFGSERYGLRPDMVSLAKGITGAYQPLGAALLSPRVAEALDAHSGEIGMLGHGYTYAGHPVACAVALEAIKIYKERDLPARVAAMEDGFLERLRHAGEGSPHVGNTRGVGLLGALEWSRDPDRWLPFPAEWKVGKFCSDAARERGVLVRAVGDIMAVSPALTITEDELDEIFDGLRAAIEDTERYIQKKEAEERTRTGEQTGSQESAWLRRAL